MSYSLTMRFICFMQGAVFFHAALAVPRCTFSTGAGLTYDLGDASGFGRLLPPGLPPMIVAGGRAPALNTGNYYFSACEEFSPAAIFPNCGAGSVALFQVARHLSPSPCYAVARLAGAEAAPLGGGRVGLQLKLSGGDGCGGDVLRRATVLYECAAFHGAVVDEGPEPCHYTLHLFGPAGCPTQCARSVGGVCGGAFRGACVLRGSSAECACHAGWGGPGCGVEDETAGALPAPGSFPSLISGPPHAAAVRVGDSDDAPAADTRFLWLLGLLAGAAASRTSSKPVA